MALPRRNPISGSRAKDRKAQREQRTAALPTSPAVLDDPGHLGPGRYDHICSPSQPYQETPAAKGQRVQLRIADCERCNSTTAVYYCLIRSRTRRRPQRHRSCRFAWPRHLDLLSITVAAHRQHPAAGRAVGRNTARIAPASRRQRAVDPVGRRRGLQHWARRGPNDLDGRRRRWRLPDASGEHEQGEERKTKHRSQLIDIVASTNPVRLVPHARFVA